MKQPPGLPSFLPHLHKTTRIVPPPDTSAETTEDGKPVGSPVREEELREHGTRQLTSAAHETIAYLRNLHPAELYPCHCVSFPVRTALHLEISIGETGVGFTVEW